MRVLGTVVGGLALILGGCGGAAPGDSDANRSDVSGVSSEEGAAVAELRYTQQFILERVLEKKHLAFDPQKPIPELRLASHITLAEFQDAIEPQWHLRPDVITNAYVVALNKVYLMDDAAYYEHTHRCIDDSLAHELTHYVQVHYQGWVLDGQDDSIESNAIEIQTWFREQFCPGAARPAPPSPPPF